MVDNKVLEVLRDFIKENVADKVKLEKPTEYEGDYELVSPSVYIGWVPPKNNMEHEDYDVPLILVMQDGGEDSNDEAVIDIRLGITTYDPGDTDENSTSPDFKGYRDILNLITRIRIELSNSTLIGGLSKVIKPIRWGMYEEQAYPYWGGWITFQASIIPMGQHSPEIDKHL